MMSLRYTRRTLAREIVMLVLAALFCVPLYLIITMSAKTIGEVYTDPLRFPTDVQWNNYPNAWRAGDLGGSLVSSVIITGGTIVLLIIIGSFCAHLIARRSSRLTTCLYVAFVLGIVVPYQLAIIPIYEVMHRLGLVGNYAGLIIVYSGILMPVSVFLYTGFIRALPRDYEDAARVDGAGPLRTFCYVVFPLLRPVTATVAVVVGLFVWNDFFISLIFLLGSSHQTLPVALYSYVGQSVTQWNLIFAAVLITMAPAVAFYLTGQRHLIHGFRADLKA
jgi:raffinose/stachyose/melibiose transport system permease protein